jgi:hypothetical protein
MLSLGDVAQFLTSQDVPWDEANSTTVVAELRGTNKHTINVAITVGERTFRVESFVARKPDENGEGVYRWLLEQNAKLRSLAYFVDHFGDVYIAGSMPNEAMDIELFDQLLGGIMAAVDASFNPILELGFKSAIEREWSWRTSNGMSTENLEAFKHLFQK